MPVATINPDETHEFELKSLEGGKVTLKRLSYGDWLTRQEMAIQIELSGKKGGGGEVNLANKAVTTWEFKNCIVDHNLTDSNALPLDFRSAATISMLDPKVGTEIGTLIMGLHDFEAELPN